MNKALDRNTDTQLIANVKNGDAESFDILMSRYQKPVFRLAYRMLDNRDDALDVTQETFFKAYRSLKKFRGEASFRLWLEKIATNICISRYRKKRLFTGLEGVFGLSNSPHWDAEIDADVHRKTLAKAMATLTSRERAAFILRIERELSVRQTAEIMKIKEGTVKALLFRAKQKIRKAIGNEFTDREI